MLTEYETGFTIQETSELAGNALMADVAETLESLLTDGPSDASPSFTEREISASSGYAIFAADRPHPEDSNHTVRIQARLCTQGQAVTAQIRSRFLSADENDPADLTAGPPSILKEIVDGYDCKIGIDQFRYHFRREVFLVEDVPTARQVMNFITNPNRKVPVLILTEDSTGHTAIEPQDAFDYLLGLALVVRFVGNTSSHIRDATGQACYDGAMRFYWPGGSVSGFYWPQYAATISITQFQKDCIDNAEIQDLNGDFEQIFSSVRTRVIRERRTGREQTAQNETATQLKEAMERVSELERQAEETEAKHSRTVDELLEQLNSASTNSTSDSDKDKEIRRLNTAVNQWKRRLRQSDESNKELKETNRELTENLECAVAEAAAAKMPAITETTSFSGLKLSGNARIDNITILNHAINIYRDPARRYIINSLRKHYNSELKLRDALERTMNSNDDRRRLQKAAAKGRPQDGIDVGHFEYIVMDNRACFGDKARLSTKMSEVRAIRNVAAHPEYNGIDNLMAQDGLYKVVRALKEMNNNDDSKLVEQLLPLVR